MYQTERAGEALSTPDTKIGEGGEEGDDRVVSNQSIDYEVYGLHHVQNGSYRLFGMPDGKRVDIRHIPTMFEIEEDAALAREVILLELEKDVRKQKDNLLLADAKPDGKLCPIRMTPSVLMIVMQPGQPHRVLSWCT